MCPLRHFTDSVVLALPLKQCIATGERAFYEAMPLNEVFFAPIFTLQDGSMACTVQAFSRAWQHSAIPAFARKKRPRRFGS